MFHPNFESGDLYDKRNIIYSVEKKNRKVQKKIRFREKFGEKN